jgi:acyl dehydratase
MPIDVAKVVGAELGSATSSWNSDDVILYHLGIGAGVPPTDPKELAYTYEAQLKVLPSFAVIPAFGTIARTVILPGEQTITIHQPLPTDAEVTSTGRVTDVWDKGKGAVLVAETETRSKGELLCTNRFALFLRGEGGFGGEGGPPPGNAPPDRQPDAVVESPTLPQQAALYRLSGDKNPLHIDPNMSALGGYDRPILHGLCSYGIVCKAAVDEMLGGDVTRVGGYSARFSGVLFPGETIVTSMWREGDRIVIDARCKERGTPVISNAAMAVKPG